ncbi:MAG: beta-ketoacyl synthase chain length factor [Treponema sp.]|jgi:hypothetical protein|nr:beta-ketoacyl synthase chain length factor [Treponema sp.]
MRSLYIQRFSAWAPGVEGEAQWKDWAAGKREIAGTGENPALDFLPPLFYRRLSQLTRMTIKTVHDLMPLGEGTKLVFVSLRGEISAQYRINRSLIEEGEIKPALFSLSVFNTPPAQTSIALGLKAGYTALYPAGFREGLLAAAAPILAGGAEHVALAYADEACPPEYGGLDPDLSPPLAFAALLGAEPGGCSLPLSAGGGVSEPGRLESPENFIRYCLGAEEPCVL